MVVAQLSETSASHPSAVSADEDVVFDAKQAANDDDISKTQEAKDDLNAGVGILNEMVAAGEEQVRITSTQVDNDSRAVKHEDALRQLSDIIAPAFGSEVTVRREDRSSVSKKVTKYSNNIFKAVQNFARAAVARFVKPPAMQMPAPDLAARRRRNLHLLEEENSRLAAAKCERDRLQAAANDPVDDMKYQDILATTSFEPEVS